VSEHLIGISPSYLLILHLSELSVGGTKTTGCAFAFGVESSIGGLIYVWLELEASLFLGAVGRGGLPFLLALRFFFVPLPSLIYIHMHFDP